MIQAVITCALGSGQQLLIQPPTPPLPSWRPPHQHFKASGKRHPRLSPTSLLVVTAIITVRGQDSPYTAVRELSAEHCCSSSLFTFLSVFNKRTSVACPQPDFPPNIPAHSSSSCLIGKNGAVALWDNWNGRLCARCPDRHFTLVAVNPAASRNAP